MPSRRDSSSKAEAPSSNLNGLDRRETVTIPSLPNVDQWNDFDNARKVMISTFGQVHAVERYRNTA
jgi:hypothetical protein